MSQIENLIKKHCPNGVEFKTIDEIFEIITDYTAAGSFADVAKNVTYLAEPNFALLVRTMDLKSNFTKGNLVYIDEHAYKYLWRVHLNKESIVLPNVGNCGEVYYVIPQNLPYKNCVLATNSILLRSSEHNNKFLYYVLETADFKKKLRKITSNTGQTKFNKTALKNLQIPVPPIEVQNEIVRILDTFTKLEAELEAELEARRRQYHFYRDKLLSFDTHTHTVKWVSLGEICEIITKQTGFDYSATIKPSLLYSKQENTYSFIQNKDFCGTNINFDTDLYIPIEIAEKYPKITLDKPSILISISGKIGNVGFYDFPQKAFIGGAVGICKLKENINGKFIMYYIQSKYGQQYLLKSIKAASHLNITVEDIRKFPIPFPNLEKQKEIVEILDKFDCLVNDLSVGLPAEIKARKKQYEYYRDKLLSFDEIS